MDNKTAVHAANLALDWGLSRLQLSNETGHKDSGAIWRISDEMDGILHTAISEYPADVNAVVVDARVDPGHERAHLLWESYVDAVTKQTGDAPANEPFMFRYIAHLPSNDRDLSFAYDFHPPGRANLHIDLDIRSTLGTDITLDASDIEAVKLGQVNDEYFSPHYGRDQSLPPPLTSLQHYLFYRGFSGHRVRKTDLPKRGDFSGILGLTSPVLTPDPNTGLLRNHNAGVFTGGKLTGFAAAYDDNNAPKIELYEFNGFEIPRSFGGSDLAVQAAYVVSASRDGRPLAVKKYRGNDAIARLNEVRPRPQ